MSIIDYSPQVAVLLPLFYVGWSDSVLSPSEVELIQAKIQKFEWLTDEDKALLNTWSNPNNIPSQELMQAWVKAIRSTAAQYTDDRQSLVDLGIEMAKIQDRGADNTWLTDHVREALEEIESAIGLESLELHRGILDQQQRERESQAKAEDVKFSVEKLQALLDDDYTEVREKVYTLLKDPIFEYQNLVNKSDYREQVLQWCKILADYGYGAMAFPEAYGGQDNMGAYCAVFESLGYHDLSLTVKFGVQFGLFGGSVHALGTQYHHDKYLKDIGSLALPGCFAMTETGHGSNVRELETTATYDATTDELIINSPTPSSSKDYIGNAALHARMATVFAQLYVNGEHQGVHAVLVPIRDEKDQVLEGIEIEDCQYKLGLNGVDNGRIRFNQVRVPRRNLLNRFGNIDENGQYSSPIESLSKRFFTMLGTLVGGRVCVPRAGLSAAKSGIAIAVRYALKRRQFGPDQEPETLLLDYPSHQRRLMPLLAKSYAIDFALTELTNRYIKEDKGEHEMREIETLAAGMKAYSTWFTTDALQECREACGGKGYLAENRFAALKADSDIFTTFEGDNTVLLQLVAKGVLYDFKKEFAGGGFMKLVEFAAGRFVTSVREKNFLAIRNTDERHLRDVEFHLEAFRYRQRDLTVSVGQRLRKFMSRGLDSYHAFLRCQTHLLEVAEAFIETQVLESFVEVIERCEDKELKKILKQVCDLYALHTIEGHKGWYLEQEYLSASKSKAIRKVVDKLCKLLRNNARALVDAYGIPEECLAAPIAMDK
ncbi:MAG: acyl-CoA dehydrogenase family protein [Saprospiraceae bacterium]|nr:acyl-CoA dehydrogenase family protein [Saprospiraceae bacterium]